jgi:hypothetical protein
MKEGKMNQDIRNLRLNFAVVLNADVNTIQEILEYIADLPGCRVIYQRTNAGKLYITEAE